MNKKMLFALAALLLASLACSLAPVISNNTVVGSGKVVEEPRNVGSFTSVELAGSGDVNIVLGDAQSVKVRTDDNILPLIETKVVNGKLVISTKPLAHFTTSNGMVVTVAMKSLERLTLSGSGNMHVGAMSGPALLVELPGSGDLNVEGSAEHVTVNLMGSGNVLCSALKAHNADVTLTGSGSVGVYADQSVNAKIAGSGTIRYDGNPAQVTKSITGSGQITP